MSPADILRVWKDIWSVQYGKQLLKGLAEVLYRDSGKGFSRVNLQDMQRFFEYFEICQAVPDNLDAQKNHYGRTIAAGKGYAELFEPNGPLPEPLGYNRTLFNLRALESTDMDERAIAAAAIAGFRRKPKNG